MANQFRVRKGLIVNGSGSTLLDVQGSQGQLFSITDSLSGSLFAAKDISGIPVIEAFSDNRVNIGTFNQEAIKVSGSFAFVTGSLNGTASWALNAVTASSATTSSWAINAVSSSFATTASFVTLAQTASFVTTAQTASYVLQAVSSSFASTASFVATASLANNATTAQTASFVTTAQTASFVATASWANNAISSSFATTASFAANGGVISFNTRTGAVTLQAGDISGLGAGIVSSSAFSSPSQGTLRATINGVQTDVDLGLQTGDNVQFAQVTGSNALFTGTITAQTLVVQTVTSSIDFITGSSKFGTLLTDTHQFTGSVSVTGSFAVTGRSTLNNLTGSLFGTASWAINASTSSYVLQAVSASFSNTASFVNTAQTASFVQLAQTASYVLNAVSSSFSNTASFVTLAQTSSYVLNAISSSFASTASFVTTAQTASFVTIAQTASYVLQAVSSSFSANSATASFVTLAQTASFVTTAQTASYILNAISSSFASTASFVTTAQTASFVTLAQTASFVTTAQTASFVSTASWANNAITASFVTLAQTASFVTLSQTASYVQIAQTASYVLQAVSASFATTASYATNGGVVSFNTRTGAVTLQATDISGLGIGIVSSSTFSSPSQGTLRAVVNGVQTDVDLGLQTADNVQFAQVTSSFTGSLIGILIGTASWANNSVSASYVLQSISSSFANTASFVTLSQTASFVSTASWSNNAITASFTTTAQTASYVLQAVSSSFATTASYAINGGVTSFNNRIGAVTLQAGDISGLGAGIVSSSTFSSPSQGTLRAIVNGVQTDVDLGLQSGDNVQFAQVTGSSALFTGTIIAQTLVVQTVTSSTDFITGSSRFGSLLTDTHQFTGSVSVTGSFTVTGRATINNLTGSLFGTASWASNAVTSSFVTTAQTASYVLQAVSSSFASTASFVTLAQTASFVTLAQTASFVTTAQTASFVATASWANNATTASFVTLAQTASFVTLSQTASRVSSNLTQGTGIVSFTYNGSSAQTVAVAGASTLTTNELVKWNGTAFTDSNIFDDGTNVFITASNLIISGASTALVITGSVRSLGGFTGSLVGTASWANNAITASFVTLAQTASFVTLSQTASFITLAQTASFVTLSQTASFVATAQTASYVTGSIFSQGNLARSASYAVTASYVLGGGSGTPGGINTQIQYNNGGAFGGVSVATFDGSVFRATGSFSGSFTGDGSGLTNLGFGDTRKLTQTTLATTWSFSHNMAERYPVVTVYDNSENVVIPGRIESVDENNLKIYFKSPTAGTAVATVGGNAVTASYVSNAVTIGTTNLISEVTSSLGATTTTISRVWTGSYSGAFWNYVANNSTNFRAGTVIGVWNKIGSAEYTDTSTPDIGDTSQLTFSVVITGEYADLRATTTTSGWNIKTFKTSI